MPDSTNEQHHFAPHDVAGMFGVSVMTVRRWADYHKEHLSESANPPSGEKRSFTWTDVEKFRQIKTWRDAGLSVDAINKRLTGNVTVAITPTVTADSIDAIETAQEKQDDTTAITVALHAITTLQRDVEALKDLSQTQASSQRDATQAFAYGFIAAAIFFLIIVLMAWVYGG